MMNRDRGDNPKLTLLPFLITAMSRALADFPMLNATFDDEANGRHPARRGAHGHGDADAERPDGRDHSRRPVQERLAARVGNHPPVRGGPHRQGDARGTERRDLHDVEPRPDGRHHLDARSSIRPQVAIIAVNKIEEKIVPIDGEIEIRKRMNLSLSCDHRVVDGWDAASFMQAMKPLIENPLRLLA